MHGEHQKAQFVESFHEPALLVEGEPTAADWTVLDGNSAALKTLDMPRSTLQGTPLWGLFAMPSKVHTLISTQMQLCKSCRGLDLYDMLVFFGHQKVQDMYQAR